MNRARSFIVWVQENTPMLMLIVGALSFVLFGVLEGAFYHQSMKNSIGKVIVWLVAIGVPIMVELGRLTFLMAAISNFTNKKQKHNGLFGLGGLVLSALFCGFQWHEANQMTDLWAKQGTPLHETIWWLFMFLIVSGLLVEIRLIFVLFEDK